VLDLCHYTYRWHLVDLEDGHMLSVLLTAIDSEKGTLDSLDAAFAAVKEKWGTIDFVLHAIAFSDKDQLVGARYVMTLDDIAWDATSRHRFRALLVATFAGLALLMAMIGVFGVLAYSVQQRVRDFGVRRALGATSSDVLRLVANSAVRVIAAGAAIGLALAAVFSRLLTTMLFGVAPLDPATFAFVAIALVVTAVAAVAGPAWRAARIDPAVALRTD
jgi:putative ABC transport system permease protein